MPSIAYVSMFRPHNALLVAMMCIGAASISGAQDTSPRAAQLVQMRCTVCHGVDLLEQQRLTREGWEREVAKMRGWGAAVEPSQAGDVAAYLAARYPLPLLKQVTIASNAGPAADLLNTRCTVCHRTDLIEAQRLDAEGWRRELAKMVGWGAVLSPDERKTVLDYLVSADVRR